MSLLPKGKNVAPRLFDATKMDILPLAEVPEYRDALAEFDKLKRRSAQVDRRRKTALSRARHEKPNRSITDRAADLVAGAIIPGVDAAAELQACNDEDSVLGPAMAAQMQRIDEIRGRLSFETTRQFADQINAALLAAFAATESLWSSYSAIYAIQGNLRAFGYEPFDHAAPTFMPRAAYALGDPARDNTQAAEFRRWLEGRGLLQVKR